MWNYEKRLQYPVKITQTNPKIAQIIITQFGGPDGELAASMRIWLKDIQCHITKSPEHLPISARKN